jgi:hypothetical protein
MPNIIGDACVCWHFALSLARLKQHFEMATKRRIAAEDAADGDHEADGEIQESLRCEDTQGLRLEAYAKL